MARRPCVVLALVITCVGGCSGSSSTNTRPASTLPAPVVSGTRTVEPPARVVADTSGIAGVVAYDVSGWPASTGPAGADALPHTHVAGPVTYSVTPPVGGDHNGTWMNCGVYPRPVPSERAVHNLEHGAVWITYRPDLAATDLGVLKEFVRRQPPVALAVSGQTLATHERYVDLTPFLGLPSPVVISSWGHQLRVDSPADPRLQQFVDTFRVNRRYSPEYGASCDDIPGAVGGRPELS